jgi:hypothetical protein
VFEDTLRNLRDLKRGVEISVPFEVDDRGYYDRQCPARDCGAQFKVMLDDWRDLVSDEVAYCPICGHGADSSAWNTPEQAQYLQKAAATYVQGRIGHALHRDAKRFNARQDKRGLVPLSMSYRPGLTPTPVPAIARDVMTQEAACAECRCRYASTGAAVFCPCCGHNSVLATFTNSVATVRGTMDAIGAIRAAMVETADENVAEDAIRHICENGLVKLVSSFERYAEASFMALPNASQFEVRQNLFQNLQESDRIWRSATTRGYTDTLSKPEWQSLERFFQQRHVLVHCDGIVDKRYVDKTGEVGIEPGQRLVVREASVLQLAGIVYRLAASLGEQA